MALTLNLQSSPEEVTTNKDLLGLDPIPEDPCQRFLRFRLSDTSITFIPLKEVLEVHQLSPVDILPIPEMADFTMGICRWRGNMLWLVDLNLLVGNNSIWHQNPLLDNLFVIVVQTAQQSIGLVVESVDDIEFIDPKLLEPPTEFSDPGLSPYVAGYLSEHKGIVLNANAIGQKVFQGSI